MTDPIVSIIIPTYGGEEFIEDAISSVLNQTFADLELIVVNDASPDNTDAILRGIDDPRLKYLIHETNQGAVAARYTALHNSRGRYIAFLDQDDLFHPEKLEIMVGYLEENPDIGVAYNGRYDILTTRDSVFRIWIPPAKVTLTDMIVGFPFAPSDTVFRREWALMDEIWQYIVVPGQEVIVNGGEYVYCGRLSFAGCRFGGVPRALNYRRFHPGRVFSDLETRCRSELACQRLILDDPHCPADTKAAAQQAYANTYEIWSYYAYAQGDTALAKQLLQDAIDHAPTIPLAPPDRLIDFMIFNCIADPGRDFQKTLAYFFDNLPDDLSHLAPLKGWGIARAFLQYGTNEIMWGRDAAGKEALREAAARRAVVDEIVMQKMIYMLMLIEEEFGAERTQEILHTLSSQLGQIADRQIIRHFLGGIWINKAFKSYRNSKFREVPGTVLQAIRQQPNYLTNRGVLSMFGRSLFKMI